MTPPRTFQTITLPDGRTLAYAEYGDPNGTPLLFFHGFGGTHLGWGYLAPNCDAEKAGVRIIAPDRPGTGRSTFQPNRQFDDWPADVNVLADALGLDRFSILGVSGGGPYALACAAAIPDRLTHVGVVTGMGPVDAPGAKSSASMRLSRAPGVIRALLLALLSLRTRYDPEGSVRLMRRYIASVDHAMYDSDEMQAVLLGSTRESRRQGGRGFAHEAWMYGHPWPFDLDDIPLEVHLWYGGADIVVTPEVGQWLHEVIPQSHLTIWEGEGHLSWSARYAGDVLAALSQ